jgi:DNA-binding transcriptional MerR regulator
LSWEKQNSDGTRYYNKNEALKRLEEIKRLEKEGFTSKEIKEFLSKYLFKSIKDLE